MAAYTVDRITQRFDKIEYFIPSGLPIEELQKAISAAEMALANIPKGHLVNPQNIREPSDGGVFYSNPEGVTVVYAIVYDDIEHW